MPVHWPGGTVLTICQVTLGESCFFFFGWVNSPQPPSGSPETWSRWAELGQVPLRWVLAACRLEGTTSAVQTTGASLHGLALWSQGR